jgi:hypothetical protein
VELEPSVSGWMADLLSIFSYGAVRFMARYPGCFAIFSTIQWGLGGGVCSILILALAIVDFKGLLLLLFITGGH